MVGIVHIPSHCKVKPMLIGELAQRSGIPPRTLRFYETAGVLPGPERTPSGYRIYGNDALDRLAFIRAAQAASLTLAEIRSVIAIRASGNAPCSHVLELLDAKALAVTRQIAELRTLRRELDRLRTRSAAAGPAACDAARVCDVLLPASELRP